MRNDSIVYHYCSIESFYSIIQNNTIRLTNIRKTNDREEIQYCFSAFENALREACHIYADISNDSKIKSFFKEIDYHSLVLKATRNDSMIYYAACFSNAEDSLGQWRAYADDGRGISIGFYSKPFINVSDYSSLCINQIIYDIEEQKQKLVRYVVDKLITASKKKSKGNSFPFFETEMNEIISYKVYNAVFYKNKGFEAEKEWRMVFYPFGNIRNLKFSDSPTDLVAHQLLFDRMGDTIHYSREYKDITRSKLKFKHTDDQIISFVEMDFSKIKNDFLANILIRAKSKVDDHDLRLFLISQGYDITKILIKKSEITYQ